MANAVITSPRKQKAGTTPDGNGVTGGNSTASGNSIVYHVSSSPHIRSRLSTGQVMYDVILALMPATFFGVWKFGFHALLVILMSVVSAAAAEFIFDYVTGKMNTLTDGSAVLTGLLLALCLPPSVPLYIPYIGALFAVVVVKGLFGGLGRNFMNPALGGRCFLLLSFASSMTRYTVDGVTGATPLETLASGGAVNVVQLWTGHGGGVIGCSALALLVGGLFLWAIDGITWHIPVSVLASFTLFMAAFGGQGFSPAFLAAHIAGGGVMMAAFFMATDPVTSPVTAPGQLFYGTCVGILSGLFRVYGTGADSVSYAVILSNLAVPLIDEYIVPRPYSYRGSRNERALQIKEILIPAAVVCAALLVSAFAIGLISGATESVIAERQLAENVAAYQEALPVAAEADAFGYPAQAVSALEALDGGVYGTDFGEAYIHEVVAARDADGNDLGYILSASSAEGREGPITLSVGLLPDGTITGIVFTEMNETLGIGTKADEPAFKDQFAGLRVSRITLNADVDAVSGATITSAATVNAVIAALDFFAAYLAAS